MWPAYLVALWPWLAGAIAGALLQHVVVRIFGERLDHALLTALSRRPRPAHSLRGTWESRYQYLSSDGPAMREDVHTVKISRFGRRVVIRSVKGSGPSVIWADCLYGERGVLTGTWTEQAPGERSYQGAVQLLMSRTGNELTGKWVGYCRKDRVQCGDWTFRRV
jgi:hypothetical protein